MVRKFKHLKIRKFKSDFFFDNVYAYAYNIMTDIDMCEKDTCKEDMFIKDTEGEDNSYCRLKKLVDMYSVHNKGIYSLNQYPFPVIVITILKEVKLFNGYQSLINFQITRTSRVLDDTGINQLNQIITRINNYPSTQLLAWLQEHINLNMRLIYSIKKHEKDAEEDKIIVDYIHEINNNDFGLTNIDVNGIIKKAKKNESWLKDNNIEKHKRLFKEFPVNRRYKVYMMAFRVMKNVYGIEL